MFFLPYLERQNWKSHGVKRGSRNSSSTHKKEKNRETKWKLDWWSAYRVWLWNPNTRHTYRTYLMEQNICKYLVFFIVMSQFSVSVSMWIWGHHVCYLLNYKMLCKQNLVPTKILKYFRPRYITLIINEIVKEVITPLL